MLCEAESCGETSFEDASRETVFVRDAFVFLATPSSPLFSPPVLATLSSSSYPRRSSRRLSLRPHPRHPILAALLANLFSPPHSRRTLDGRCPGPTSSDTPTGIRRLSSASSRHAKPARNARAPHDPGRLVTQARGTSRRLRTQNYRVCCSQSALRRVDERLVIINLQVEEMRI